MVYAVSHGDFVDKLPVMAASGNAPDVVLYADFPTTLSAFLSRSTPTSSGRDFRSTSFFRRASISGPHDGQIYALPTSRNHAAFCLQ